MPVQTGCRLREHYSPRTAAALSGLQLCAGCACNLAQLGAALNPDAYAVRSRGRCLGWRRLLRRRIRGREHAGRWRLVSLFGTPRVRCKQQSAIHQVTKVPFTEQRAFVGDDPPPPIPHPLLCSPQPTSVHPNRVAPRTRRNDFYESRWGRIRHLTIRGRRLQSLWRCGQRGGAASTCEANRHENRDTWDACKVHHARE